MTKEEAKNLVVKTFEQSFDEARFLYFIKNLLNDLDESKAQSWSLIPELYRDAIKSYKRIGQYTDENNNVIDVLTVNVKRDNTLERARTLQRNFIARHLKKRTHEAALVAFYTDDFDDWRFSLVKLEYELKKKGDGKVKIDEELSPAKRYSFLVGVNERSHTAQNQFVNLFSDKKDRHSLKEIEEAFNIETVTKEFFLEYRNLFIRTKKSLDKILSVDSKAKSEFENKGVDSVNFAKKLLGQIVFLYFLQKKGWFGVARDDQWGEGSKKFLRELLEGKHGKFDNFFNDILEPLFYEALRIDRSHDDHYYSRFNCKIPFLNGGLFDPLGDYNWVTTDITLPNELFSNTKKARTGDIGDGILDIFDRYNFTVIEDEPLEKEVAIDPELLGKAYEKFNAIRPDNFDEYIKVLKSSKKGEETKFNKQYGVYYTPREIVHYMCRESLINYLASEFSDRSDAYQKIDLEQLDVFGHTTRKGQLPLEAEYKSIPYIPKTDIETLINYGELLGENEAVVEAKGKETETYYYKLPDSIRKNAKLIDTELSNILVCDPAVGSGAFPVGMMHEIISTRNLLSIFINDKTRSKYLFKRECIEKSLYGVDIDSGAVEIAKLRLWLSLVVDEIDINNIRPLPNLDYKIACGNSLIGFPENWKSDISDRIEKLKTEYLIETKPTNKKRLKEEIDQQIKNRILRSKTNFGYEINFDLRTFFSEVYHFNNGFDIIITNPPYLGQKGNKEIFQSIKLSPLGKKYHQRRMDLFYFFFHIALENVRENGIISFITTGYFLTATYSDKLRNHIKNVSSVLCLLNFNEYKIFESAQGQHNLITSLIKNNSYKLPAKTAIVDRSGYYIPNELQSVLDWQDDQTRYFEVPQSEIFEDETNYIRLEPHNSFSMRKNPLGIFSKLENFETLDEYCFIEQGIVSGADKVTESHLKRFLKLNAQKDEGIFILTEKELHRLSLSDSEYQNYVQKTYKNSSIERWTFRPKDNLFVLYIKSNGEYFDPGKNIRKHLDRFKIILINRNVRDGSITEEDYKLFIQGKKYISYIMIANSFKAGNYYCISYARRGKDTFEEMKIVNSRRARSNIFALETDGYYEQSDIVITTLKPQYKSSIKLEYILALLNSNLYYYWFLHKGKMKGEMFELFQKPISETKIIIPKLSIQNQIAFLVEKITSQLKINQRANVSQLENKLNYSIYKLYNLTYEEVKIIDPNIGEIISEENYNNEKLFA